MHNIEWEIILSYMFAAVIISSWHDTCNKFLHSPLNTHYEVCAMCYDYTIQRKGRVIWTYFYFKEICLKRFDRSDGENVG